MGNQALYACMTALACSAGVPLASVAADLLVPGVGAETVLRNVVLEGRAKREPDRQGRFVSATTRRCPRGQAVIAPDAGRGPCPGCGGTSRR